MKLVAGIPAPKRTTSTRVGRVLQGTPRVDVVEGRIAGVKQDVSHVSRGELIDLEVGVELQLRHAAEGNVVHAVQLAALNLQDASVVVWHQHHVDAIEQRQ